MGGGGHPRAVITEGYSEGTSMQQNYFISCYVTFSFTVGDIKFKCTAHCTAHHRVKNTHINKQVFID